MENNLMTKKEKYGFAGWKRVKIGELC